MAKNIVLCDEPTCFVKPPFYGGKKTEHHCTTSNPLFTPKKADSFRELSKDNSKLKYRPKTPLASNPRLFTLHHDPFSSQHYNFHKVHVQAYDYGKT